MGCQGGFCCSVWASLLSIVPRHWGDLAEVAGAPCRHLDTGGHCSSSSAHRVQAAPSTTSLAPGSPKLQPRTPLGSGSYCWKEGQDRWRSGSAGSYLGGAGQWNLCSRGQHKQEKVLLQGNLRDRSLHVLKRAESQESCGLRV